MNVCKPNHFVAIDIGTSFIKGAVVDLQVGSLSHICRQPFPEPLPNLPANFFEVDPGQLVSAVRRLLDELFDLSPECSGVLTCTQMHGLVLTDGAYQPLSNVITWRDQRAVLPHPSGDGSFFDHLLFRLSEQELAEVGGGLRAGLPAGSLFWMVETGRLPARDAIPLTLSEFVFTQLCSTGVNPIIEPTNADAYGVYHLEQGTWHSEVLKKLGLAELRWPDIGPAGSIVGYIERNDRKIPCMTAVGDHQCALAGTFLEMGELSLNISTGSQASLLTTSLKMGDYQTRPYFDDRYLNTVVKIPAGRSLALLVELLTELAGGDRPAPVDPWTAIVAAVDGVDQTDLVVDLSFFDSTAASSGSISNIREDNFSVGHLFRAAFENMASNYLEYGRRLAGGQNDWHRIVFSGGLAQKIEPLRRIVVDHFACEYRICVEEEDTLLGLMVLALYGAGEAATIGQATGEIRARRQVQ